MATGNTQVGYGTTLTWNSVAVAKLTKIGKVSLKTDEADIKTFDAANRTVVTRAGLIKYDPIDVEGVLATDDTSGQMALIADAQGKIRIRYLSGLNATMRISFDSRIFEILSIIQPKEINDQYLIIYKERLD